MEGFAQYKLRVCVVGDAGKGGYQVPGAVVVVLRFNAKFCEELDAGFCCVGVLCVGVIFDVGAVFSQCECGFFGFFKYAGQAVLSFGGVGCDCAVDQGAIIFGCEVVPVQVFAYLCDVQLCIGFFAGGLDAGLVFLICR